MDRELKEKVIWWIQHATDEERSSFSEVMLCKQMMLDEWLKKFGATDGEVDELVVYVVSRLLWEPIVVITKTPSGVVLKEAATTSVTPTLCLPLVVRGILFLLRGQNYMIQVRIVVPIILLYVLPFVFCISDVQEVFEQLYQHS